MCTRLSHQQRVCRSFHFNKLDGVRDIEDYLDPSPVAPLPVTFDRITWDESDDASLVFLTYGTPELTALLPAIETTAGDAGANE